jgi:glycosyltransferase involved in cell wall biosynthesis
MKTMHVTWGLSPGGTENLIVDIANEQAKSSSVAILVINNNVANSLLEEINTDVQVFRINRKPKTRNILDQLKILAIVLKQNPDILHLHHYGLYSIVRFAGILRIPTYLTVHSTHYPCVHLNNHKKLFAISETVRRDLQKKCNVTATTVLNGINTDGIRQRTSTLWTSEDTFRIVQVSRLEHMVKGQHILLFALRKLIDDFQISNISVDFIGAGNSLLWLKDLAQKLQLQDHCRFLGEQSRTTIYATLANYHLLVQPSLWEGFGLTMIEAMAAKVPVLASDIDAPKELLQDGTYGFLFLNKDPLNLAKQLEYIMGHYNLNKIQDTIGKAYSYAIANFNIKKTSLHYSQNYM